MDEFYTSFHYSPTCPIPILENGSNSSIINYDQQQNMSTSHVTAAEYYVDDDDEGLLMERERSSDDDIIKSQIATHPLYPVLLSSYIDCTKVGAPPEMASVLEEISKENQPTILVSSSGGCEIGTDPQLDHFMKSYCDALNKYKEELSKPFNEATNFLITIGSQLTHLCKETLPTTTSTNSHHSTADSEEEKSLGEVVEAGGGGENELKEMLMRKYSGFVSDLRSEMLKKRKKGKLPKDAISALLDWWNSHYRWPYPTEEEKNMLSEMTGLEQKQINNWFINQRKRHWRPSHDMTVALMEGVAGGGPAAVYFDAAAAGTGGGGDHNNIST